MRRHILLLVAVLSTVTACATDDTAAPDETPTSVPDATATAEAGLAQTCEAEAYTIAYPEGWYEAEAGEDCRWFHPEPFELPLETEVTWVAVHASINPVAYATITDNLGAPEDEVVSRQELQVAGNPSLRVETRSGGQALLPEGAMTTTYYVDVGAEQTFIASTSTVARDGTYEDNVEVLEHMVQSVEFSFEAGAEATPTGGPATGTGTGTGY